MATTNKSNEGALPLAQTPCALTHPLGLEKDLWRRVVKPHAQRAGYHCFRIENPVYPGTPDVYACKGGYSVWIELKRMKGKVSSRQQMFMDEMREMGVPAYVIRGGRNDRHQWWIIISAYNREIVKNIELDGDVNVFDCL